MQPLLRRSVTVIGGADRIRMTDGLQQAVAVFTLNIGADVLLAAQFNQRRCKLGGRMVAASG